MQTSALTVVEVENGAGASVHDEVCHHQGIKTDVHSETIRQTDLQTPSGIVAIAMRLRIVRG